MLDGANVRSGEGRTVEHSSTGSPGGGATGQDEPRHVGELTSIRVGRGAVGFVLDLDPDLGSGVGDEEWEVARRVCRGELLSVPPGRWSGPADAHAAETSVGVLIVTGMMCREVRLRDRHLLEFLGPGDVLQLPVADDGPGLGGPVVLTAILRTELLVLGEPFVRAAARWPSLLVAIQRRLESERQRLAVQGLITHVPRAEHRLLLMLRHLADRWGRVTPEGITLPLPLTHDLLGQLTAARRSTTTLALNELEDAGYIKRLPDGSWLLTAAGQRQVEAIANSSATTRSLGELIATRRQANESRESARALRAEANLARAHRQRRDEPSRPAPAPDRDI